MNSQTQNPRRILMTAALPYANGNIHLGHLVEYIQADVWARFQRLRGHECHFVCADDTHGTAIMIEAKKRHTTPEKVIAEVWNSHTEDFQNFEIDFAHYSSTNSEENRALCEYFFEKMSAKGHIKTKNIEQLFCEHDKMFLPDRFVKGTCPKCGSKDQYGDSCDVCGATYSPKEMKDQYCSICGTPPVTKESEHLLFKLEDFKSFLEEWLPKHTSKEVSNKMSEWFKEPLRDWDISRDAPYFGFLIPGFKDKYFYVWVDAPMGYVSTTQQLCKMKGMSFDDFWKSDKTEVYHFIGKDIVYFHTLFWPALLKAADFRTPTSVFVHGHLTVNGQKMSKSKGTQVQAKTYLKHLPPNFLRYYYTSKMGPTADDLDLNFDDFVQRVNSDLVGKITNLGSRGAQMLNKSLGGELGELDNAGQELMTLARAKAAEIEKLFEEREFNKAIAEIRSIADDANRYFDERAPWKTVATDPEGTRKVLSATLNAFRMIAILLKPVLPSYAAKAEALFHEKDWKWSDLNKTLESGRIAGYEHLMQRVDPKAVEAIMTESAPPVDTQAAAKPTAAKTDSKSKSAKPEARNPMEMKPEIEIDAFSSVDLRVAEIIEAEAVPEADKLLRLKVSLGPLGERQIFAGIKSAYDPSKLVGRKTVVVANLKARKMKFGMSEGMVLAAGAGGKDLFILSPDDGAKAGDPVK